MTGFMDLPAELRNTIYELELTTTTKVRFEFRQDITRHYSDTVRYGHRLYADEYGPKYPAKVVKGINFSSNILLVSKKVHAEATAVLYGGNHFEIRQTWAVWFFEKIGSSIKHIRRLTITRQVIKLELSVREAIGKLQDASGIEEITVVGPNSASARVFPCSQLRLSRSEELSVEINGLLAKEYERVL